MTPNTISIAGGAGYANLGDDLIAGVLSEAVAALGTPLLVGSGPHPLLVPLREHKSLRFRPLRYARETKDLLDSRLLIIGGGGLLDDRTPLFFRRYTRMARLAETLGLPLVLLGVGISRPRSREAADAYTRTIRSARLTIVRDPQSLEVARELVPNGRLALGADCVYSLSHSSSTDSGDSDCLALNLRDWPFLIQESRWKSMDAFIGTVARLINTTNWIRKVALIATSAAPLDNDRSILRRCATQLSARVVEIPIDRSSIIRALEGSRCLISMRLHGAILGGLAGTPTIGIAYDDKLYHASHLGAMAIGLDDVHNQLGTLLNDPTVYTEAQRVRVELLHDSAVKMLANLDVRLTTRAHPHLLRGRWA
jgi:polysaccharide pyruvyl transferase WcaK-like protein